jgi:four helix bundle protein
MKINSYKDLIVWQKSMTLITDVYSISKNFPSTEIYGLTSQLRRSACSVALNIAEGYGRGSTKNYIQFLKISRGSLLELETCLQISMNLNYIKSEDLSSINQKIEEIIKMLNALIKTLNGKIATMANS